MARGNRAPRTAETRLKQRLARLGKKTGRPAWNTGLTYMLGKKPERWKAKNGVGHSIWRDAVFAQEKFICVDCKKDFSGKQPAYRFLSAIRVKSWEEAPDLRFKVANGRAICRICFYKKSSPDRLRKISAKLRARNEALGCEKIALYNEWQAAVFKRDNSTCQDCKEPVTGKQRQAHHLKPREAYPELIFDVNNGLTLCAKCHSTRESIIRRETALKMRQIRDRFSQIKIKADEEQFLLWLKEIL